MIHMCDALDALREGYKQEYLLQGVKQGIKQEQKKNVQTMLSKGFEVSVIAECLSLTETQVSEYANLLAI